MPHSGKLCTECSVAISHLNIYLCSYIAPWRETYKDELEMAISLGPEGYDKLKHPLKSSKGNQIYVLFEDDSTARIIA